MTFEIEDVQDLLRTYRIWRGVVSRGTGKASQKYYADRGITVSKEWLVFENFLRDMGLASPTLSLDRIDVNGNYEKGNCRWATVAAQARNKVATHYVMWNGVKTPLVDVADSLGIDAHLLRTRLSSDGTYTPSPVTESKRYSNLLMLNSSRERIDFIAKDLKPEEGKVSITVEVIDLVEKTKLPLTAICRRASIKYQPFYTYLAGRARYDAKAIETIKEVLKDYIKTIPNV